MRGPREESEGRAVRLARSLEERGLSTSIRGAAVAVPGSGHTLWVELSRTAPWLSARLVDGRLVFDAGALSDEEVSKAADAIAAAWRKVEGFLV
jgi:hypothetical protein